MYEALGARERALLVLQAFKEGEREDPDIRATLPWEQAQAFNEYISLMNAVNCGLGTFLAYLDALIDQLNLRLGWLQTIDLCSMTVFSLAAYIAMYTKEAITESDYAKAEQKEREEMLPAAELAELLAERELGEDAPEEGPEWEAALKRKTKEIKQLVEKGVLVGRPKGKRVLINNGSFSDWLGEPVPVFPDWCRAYEVFPDSEAKKVRFLRDEHSLVQQTLAERLHVPRLDLPFTQAQEPDRITGALLETLRHGIVRRHSELRAAEIVIAEVGEKFGIDDPLVPVNRRTLDMAKETLEDVRTGLQRYAGEIELPEPDEDDIAMMRKLLDAHRDP